VPSRHVIVRQAREGRASARSLTVPHRGVRHDAGDIRQAQRRDIRTQIRIGAIAGVHQDHALRQTSLTGPPQLFERYVWLRPEADVIRHTCLCCAVLRLPPSLSADTSDRLPAGLLGDWLATALPRLGNCPACRAGRNIGVPHRPSVSLAWGTPCHR
jgi:hypothetical protein